MPDRLVDLIRSGKAPEVLRRIAAKGDPSLPAEDKIEILTLLAADPVADVREKALEALQRNAAPKSAVAEAAAAPSSPPQPEPLAPPPLPEAAQETTAAPAPGSAPNPQEEAAAIEILAKVAAGANVDEVAGAHIEAPPEVTKSDDQLTKKERETLIEKINRMSVVEKIKAALTGNMETRSLLIRDSNKIISRAVLQSPKISDTEMESYAAAKNVSEEVLRLIASNRKYMKTYVVMRALINNPRAPIDVTMPLINRVNEKDLKGLSLNRNVPEVIRSLAIKAIKQKEEANKPKLPKK